MFFRKRNSTKVDLGRETWRDILPRRSVSRGAMVDPNSPRILLDQSQIVGLSYEYLNADGSIQKGLRIEENRVAFLIGNYTHWDEIWPEIEGILRTVIDRIDDGNPIRAFSSEYTDLFVAEGAHEEFDASQILKAESNLLSGHIFERKLNWHMHTGFFEFIDDPAPHRVLTRVNLDLRDNSDKKRRELTIVLFHSLSGISTPFVGVDDLKDAISERGLENFRHLHDIDRKTVQKILCDDMLERIGL